MLRVCTLSGDNKFQSRTALPQSGKVSTGPHRIPELGVLTPRLILTEKLPLSTTCRHHKQVHGHVLTDTHTSMCWILYSDIDVTFFLYRNLYIISNLKEAIFIHKNSFVKVSFEGNFVLENNMQNKPLLALYNFFLFCT